MAKKSSGGISFGSIVFLIIMYNFIFDDNGDKKEVDIVKQDTIVQTAPAQDNPTIKDSLNEISKEFKQLGGELKKEVIIISEDLKKEFKATEPKEDPPEKEEEIMIATPEKEEENLKSLDTPKTETMKKL